MSNAEADLFDVAILGAGPAGTTVAALLARRGRRVVALEKARHPRFHIGESLLPKNLPILERLGVLDQVRAIGVHKPGAELISPDHAARQSFRFSEALDPDPSFAYQVQRDAFDEILLRNARDAGAEIREGCTVTDVAFGKDTQRVVYTQNTAEAAVLELLKQPTTQERVLGSRTSIIPGVTLNSIVLDDQGLATVDFSHDLVFGLGGSCNVQALQSQIRNTLTQFSSVKDVKILVDGQDAEMTIQP